eukprot:TRINITY_DN3183_c0_g1_i1.p2 TRINITY_DN3183_c0_g1~~TRINITY_DN3183_c0_g1_i1.p2  ORF type:complete len:410 (-),score=96.92 TRINITY_DN3183_c0_g1_i1:1376-2605(-)
MIDEKILFGSGRTSGQFHLTEVGLNKSAMMAKEEEKPVKMMYKIEDADVPTHVNEQTMRLPPKVEIRRVVVNILSAMPRVKKEKVETSEHFDLIDGNTGRLRNKDLYSTWLYFLLSEPNRRVISAAFWYAFLLQLHPVPMPEVESAIYDRLALDYVALVEWLSTDKNFSHIHDTNIFLANYYDVVSQAVFYSFFYAFPKSRVKFDDKLAKELFSCFAKMFTGMKISNVQEHLRNWYLDMGAGNILKLDAQTRRTRGNDIGSLLPMIDKGRSVTSQKREKATIKYSPIMERYLTIKNYKTRNYLRDLKVKMKQVNQEEAEAIESRIQGYHHEVRELSMRHEAMKAEDRDFHLNIVREIKKIKLESQEHQRRLEKRKNEELEKGAHEYANYLVSMLNSGITNLMMTNQNQN